MKVIGYSLFGDPDSFEFQFYLRGIYFNARMNRLLYPGWTMIVHFDVRLCVDYCDYLIELTKMFNFTTVDLQPKPKCESMLWRMLPVYNDRITHVICRDADAITTYREAQAVQEWVDSGLGFHGITDDPAHTIPLMGGMCGVKVDHFKQTFPEYDSFEKLVAGNDLSNHGSDQNLLMKKIYPRVKDNMMGHFFKGCNEQVKITRHQANVAIPGVNPKLWESNLTCRMIGSPGVVDFELLRFFDRFDKQQKYIDFENKFKDIMYWRR
jgi:hypothetical protein